MIYRVYFNPTDHDYRILKRYNSSVKRSNYPSLLKSGFKSREEAQRYINEQWHSPESYFIGPGSASDPDSPLTRTQLTGESHASKERQHPASQRSGCLGFFILFIVLGLSAATIAGVLIYNHLTKPTVKIPAALIPQITHVSTYQEGVLVYVRVQYSDPGHYAEGFGFVGANGSGWAEENHSFANPSYGIPGPDRIDYPFNSGCGTGNESTSYVQFWINDTAGGQSAPVTIYLACKG